jgi:hypothetical protein
VHRVIDNGVINNGVIDNGVIDNGLIYGFEAGHNLQRLFDT